MNDPLPSREIPAGVDANIKAGLPPAPTSAPGEPVGYAPISGWAIAGLAASIGFTKLVVISAAVAFYQGAPFFFPVWIMGLALLAIGLSLYGQRHVQTSEG